MTTEKSAIIKVGDLQLEAMLRLPAGNGPFPASVVCHPHPEYGGDMSNNVVIAVCRALSDANIASLRFNFRGVGASQGEYDNGIGEQDDVRGALAHLSSLQEIDTSRIGLAGYSFGAIVALAASAREERVKALALISPPLTFIPFGTDQLKSHPSPKFIICGTEDMFVRASDLQPVLEPEEFETISGADHFWIGFEKQLGPRIVSFFSRAM